MIVYQDGVATEVPLTVGKVMRFDENFSLDKTTDEATLKAILAATFNSGDASCDNVAMEVHLNIMFTDLVSTIP